MSYSSNTKNGSGSERSNDEWIVELIWAMFKATGYLLWLAILFPAVSVPAVISLVMMLRYGIGAGMLTAIGLGAGYGAWAALDTQSFEHWIARPVRQRFQMWWRYTRTWEQVCALHGLTARHQDRTLTPVVRSIWIGKHTDVIDLRVVTGQSVDDWHKRIRELAAAWRADRLIIRPTAPGELRITITRYDFLAQPIRLPRPAASTNVNLSAVPVGITDTHQWWRVPVLGHHLLIAGATGAGKGSVLWSLIAGLAPCVKTGQVRLCVIDPKGGMELGPGAGIFSAFSHDAKDTTLDLLRTLVTAMHARANRLRGHTRLHTPTPSEPLYVLIIDEIAALTAYVPDRKIRTEIEHLLGLLLSQGRAVGISVVAAIQDPSKDTLPVRQLFTVRIGLRLTETSQTAMVLGQSARDAGAECDLIADTTPGVGYVMIDGTAQPQRIRAFHVTDADITDLATRFTPLRSYSNGNAHNTNDAGPDGGNR
ncbi:FtsK/SpoIIIE domain-containing protein [Mycobacterium gastri]|uniref:Cell division protein FtsK n=1 Tax=Mycobacterium gastri TaxID=1777 RepID=A0A1X1W1B9_MYCGS|nr:FtsK/SpoIIIE domain-containing protein [Mycobacterium gastri]ETW25563.1 cell division protein FtsK [Mycobacterium gastri 'Wayne']ORV79897.1 cell division protein FtsK [Mycobacterium gastri]